MESFSGPQGIGFPLFAFSFRKFFLSLVQIGKGVFNG